VLGGRVDLSIRIKDWHCDDVANRDRVGERLSKDAGMLVGVERLHRLEFIECLGAPAPHVP